MLLLSAGSVIALGFAEVLVRMLKLAPDVAVVAVGRYRVSSNRMIGYEPIPGLAFDGQDLTAYDYRTSETMADIFPVRLEQNLNLLRSLADAEKKEKAVSAARLSRSLVGSAAPGRARAMSAAIPDVR